MQVDRRLYRTATGRVCEEDDPDAAFLLIAKGQSLPAAEAKRLGITAYLDAKIAEEEVVQAKAVRQQTTEDKAVQKDDAEDKAVQKPVGVSFPPESTRSGRVSDKR